MMKSADFRRPLLARDRAERRSSPLHSTAALVTTHAFPFVHILFSRTLLTKCRRCAKIYAKDVDGESSDGMLSESRGRCEAVAGGRMSYGSRVGGSSLRVRAARRHSVRGAGLFSSREWRVSRNLSGTAGGYAVRLKDFFTLGGGFFFFCNSPPRCVISLQRARMVPTSGTNFPQNSGSNPHVQRFQHFIKT